MKIMVNSNIRRVKKGSEYIQVLCKETETMGWGGKIVRDTTLVEYVGP